MQHSHTNVARDLPRHRVFLLRTIMSSYSRAPLPQSHCRQWAAMDSADSEMAVEEDYSETPAQ